MSTAIQVSRSDIIGLCRLCLAKDLAEIDIFETGSEYRQLFTKIVTCLPVEVTQNEDLPTRICEVCNSKVDNFYQFWTSTAKNQKQLQEWLKTATDEIKKTDITTIKVEADDPRGEDYEPEDYDDDHRGDSYDEEEDAPSAPKRIKIQHSSDIEEDTKPSKLVLDSASNGASTSKTKKSTKETVKKKRIRKRRGGLNIHSRRSKEYMDDLLKTLDIERVPLEERQKMMPKKIKQEPFDDFLHHCDKCDFSSANKKTLGSHILRRHVGFTVYCKECNLGFYSSTHLHSHGIKVHGLEPFICEHCSKSFTSKGNLTVHVKYYHAKTFFECEFCQKSFNFKTSYKRHLKQHQEHVELYPCTVCNKNLSSPYRLKTHMLIHQNNKAFTCETCGKGFIQRRYLEEHTRVHTGYKPYACDICTKQFTQKSTLNIHRKLHLNIKDFICDLCGAKFVSKAFLSYHVRKRHQLH